MATCFAACLALRAAHLALNLATRHWTYFRSQKAWFLMGHPCITFIIIIFRKINQYACYLKSCSANKIEQLSTRQIVLSSVIPWDFSPVIP